MRIGIDLDDTFTKTKENFQKYLKKYRKKHKLKKFQEKESLSYEEYLNFMEEFGRPLYINLKEKKHASKVIKKWILNGYEIYFITARNKLECKNVEEYTKEYLKSKGLIRSEIIFESKNKYKDSLPFHLDVFIDDREKVLDDFPRGKIHLIRMVSNKNVYSKYPKVTSWKELDEYIDNL